MQVTHFCMVKCIPYHPSGVDKASITLREANSGKPMVDPYHGNAKFPPLSSGQKQRRLLPHCSFNESKAWMYSYWLLVVPSQIKNCGTNHGLPMSRVGNWSKCCIYACQMKMLLTLNATCTLFKKAQQYLFTSHIKDRDALWTWKVK